MAGVWTVVVVVGGWAVVVVGGCFVVVVVVGWTVVVVVGACVVVVVLVMVVVVVGTEPVTDTLHPFAVIGRIFTAFVSNRLSTLSPMEVVVLAIAATLDRKSTRLNSSHITISYAVFCLKKKKY